MNTFTIYSQNEQYEIHVSGNFIQQITHLSWTNPEPQPVRFSNLNPYIQELILDKLSEQNEQD